MFEIQVWNLILGFMFGIQARDLFLGSCLRFGFGIHVWDSSPPFRFGIQVWD